jgi:hypothetical protein
VQARQAVVVAFLGEKRNKVALGLDLPVLNDLIDIRNIAAQPIQRESLLKQD